MGVCSSKEKNNKTDDIIAAQKKLENNITEEEKKKEDNEEAENDEAVKNESNTNKDNQAKRINFNTNAINEEIKILQIERPKNEEMEDGNMISSVISNCVMLQNLDEKAKKEVIKKMSLCKVSADCKIFKEGNIGFYFYIIKSGYVKIFIRGEYKKTLTKGESFGELALLHGGERTATAVADGEVYLWCLERTNFKKILEYISSLNYEENKKFVQSIPMLNILPDEQKCLLYNNLVTHNFKAGDYIVRKGEKALCLYIIKEGEANCTNDEGICITVKRKGEFFGERAILVDTLRTLNVVANCECICYSISIETLKVVLGEKFRDTLFKNFVKIIFQNSRYFKDLNQKLIEYVYPSFKVRNYGFHEPVLKKNYLVTQRIIVIIEGNLVKSTDPAVKVAEKGQILFEENIFKKVRQKTTEDILAKPDCLLMHVNVSEFTKVLGGSFQEIIIKSQIINTLNSVPLFKNMSQYKIEALASVIEVKKYRQGEKIVVEGEEGSQFFIVKTGQIDIFIREEWKRSFNQNDFFGERALLLREPRSATAVAKSEVECYVLGKTKFLPFLEDNLKNYLIQRIYLQDSSIQLKDLNFVKVLGKGSYGEVVLVEHRGNKQLYAIKGIQRAQIDYERLHENIEMEKKILLRIDHPFIIKLVKTLKNDTHVFFLMEYIKGKELFEIIREIGILSKYQTQFYSGSLLMAVYYLHKNKYIFRDIKPENVIIMDNGYLKLLDFGTAKEIVDRTSTVIGTPHYMAPEIIKGEGYSFSVDFWSIGICMYEFMFGTVPFGDNEEDPMEVYVLVANEDLKIPKDCKDKDFKSLINRLLMKDPKSRLSNYEKIVTDPFFRNFSFEELINMNLPPAYVPKLKPEPNVKNLAFINYMKKSKEKYDSSDQDPISKDEQLLFNKWYENFK